MSLSPAERLLLQRRLARSRRRPAGPLIAALAAVMVLLSMPLFAAAAAAIGAGVAYAALAAELDEGLARIENLGERETFETTRITDRNGTLLRLVIIEGKRTYVPLADISRPLIEATIAVEDSSYYTHPGIDAEGIGRAVLGDASALARRLLGEADAVSFAGGGSTITQQFVRHVAFSNEERMARSYRRKAKEIVLALMLTREHEKDEVLEWYLNEIYYGNLAYGIEAAAQTVFDKSASELDLAESSLIAGLPQCPGCYDPLSPDPETHAAAKRRQRVVLDLMVEAGLIDEAEADRAARQKLTFNEPDDDLLLAPHFVVWVGEVLEEMLGAERLALGGLEIRTSLDLRLQQLGERVVREQVDRLRDRHDLTNASLVAMEPRTGQVLAMVGSADYFDEEIDGKVNVALRERQPGSSIKPITYVTAIEQGMSPAKVLWDVPMEVELTGGELYEPVNYDETFRGPVRMREALANSYNIPALKLLRDIPPAETEEGGWKYGVELTVDTAHAMGITGLNRPPWDYGLSLTLGGGEVTLIDMTTAYGTLANGGELIRPHPILQVIDSDGNVLYDLSTDEEALTPERAVSEAAAYIVTDMMADNAARAPAFGTSSALQLGVPAAAKTGTTNDFRDNWTVGYTPYLVTGVWAGNSDNTQMRNSSGLTGAAPIWNGFMRNVVFDEPLRDIVQAAREDQGFDFDRTFDRPDDVVVGRVCKVASLAELSSTCRVWQRELFIEENLPEGIEEVAAGAAQNWAQEGSEEGASQDPALAGLPPRAQGDGWASVAAVVVPLPPPPPELVAAAAEAEEELKWAPARLCRPEAHGGDRAQPVAVVTLPATVDDHEFIYEWAAENGWAAVDAAEACTPEMAGAAMDPGSLPGPGEFLAGAGVPMPSSADYRLNLRPGAVLSAMTSITGTALFNPEQIQFFKVELGRGRYPGEWVTIGDIHRDPVLEGPLERLDAAALPAGDYVLRLVLVQRDGNVLEPPYSVPFVIAPGG